MKKTSIILTKILIIYILNIQNRQPSTSILSIVPIFKQSIHIEHIDSPHPQKSSGDELHYPLLVPPFGGLAGSRSLGGLGKFPPFGGLAGSRSLGGLGKVPLHHLIPLNSIVGLVHSTQSGPTEDEGKY